MSADMVILGLMLPAQTAANNDLTTNTHTHTHTHTHTTTTIMMTL